MDGAPPPPYSETDIYSASTPSALRPSPADQTADDASVTASSSHSNIIYTPPGTPDAQDDWAATRATDASPLPASVQAYFAARPAAGRPPSAHIVHAIHFAEGTAPARLPYPGWAADRQVAEQDWHDFVHQLLSPRAEKANESIIDRKPRAEQEGTPSEAVAGTQFDPIRHSADASSRERNFEAAIQTVHEWNGGFFAPRGVTLRLDPVSDFRDMPRAWDQASLDAPREVMHQSDGSDPTGWPSEAWNRGRGRSWPRGRGMFLGAIQGGRGVQGELGPHGYHGVEHGYRGHGWGRSEYAGGMLHEGRAHRSHSHSSASSDSSSSSSGSGSSVGSLPDWDEVSEAQLPIVRHSVGNWVRSDQPVPKAEYKRVKAAIKAAEGPPGARPAGSAAQRKEIKQLLAQWKEVQKLQKTAKKAAKKAAKKEKKTRKWERKAERKANKKNRKDHRHSERDARREIPTAGSHAHGTFGPAPPGAPPPGPPAAFGPWPSGPGTFGGFGPGRRGGPSAFGFFGGGRGGWGRGLFGGPGPHPPGAAAVSHAHAVRDAALSAARQQGAEATARAHAARDTALHEAAASRQRAQETAAAAVRHAHTVRDAALQDTRRQSADATARAHAALRDAAVSRQGAQAAADRARDEALRHEAAWQPWGWRPGAASMNAGSSSQAPYNPRGRDRTGSDEEWPSAASNLQTQYAQQEKREVPAAQAGPEDANVPAPARQDRATETHELENRLLALRMEADEALARQIAEEEARGGRPS